MPRLVSRTLRRVPQPAPALLLAALLAAMAAPAAAEVTAQDVWQSWQNSLAAGGDDVEITFGEVSRAAGEITVPALRIAVDGEEADLEIILNRVVFTERGDGTVGITLPSSVPVAMTMEDPLRATITLTMQISFDGLSLTASGTPDAILQAAVADEIGVSLDGITGLTPGSGIEGSATLTGVSTTSLTAITPSGARQATGAIGAAAFVYDFIVRDPFQGDTTATYRNEGLSIQIDTLTPAGALTMGTGDLLANEDYIIDIKARSLGGVADLDFADSDTRGQMSTQVAESSFEMHLEDGTLKYDVNASEIGLAIAIDDVPLPVNATLGTARFALESPLIIAEDERPFSLDIALSNLAIDERIWDFFDPDAALSRDPLSFEAALEGEGRWMIDLFDPDLDAGLGGEALPAIVTRANIASLLLSGAGAKLEADGDFTFDPSNLAAFDGFPAPDGALNVQISGVNGLIDGLIALGVLEEAQALGARMVLGIYATPAEDGSDAYSSKFEVTPEGQVRANGQRIR